MRAKGEGWVGIGFQQKTGFGMGGADIVIGFPPTNQNKKGVIGDYYALSYTYPKYDDEQNVDLVSAEYSDGWTTIEFTRKLDTGDTQDRVISSGLSNMIWAHGASTILEYHGPNAGKNRDVFQIVLFGTDDVNPLPSNAKTVEFQISNYHVPTYSSTIYACQSFTLPKVEDAHIVQFQMTPELKNLPYVHHLLVYVCSEGNGTYVSRYQKPRACVAPAGQLGGCTGVVYGWARGDYITSVPKDVGFRMGTKKSYGIQHIVIEMHYNNPNRVKIVDNTKVTFWYTPTIRKHDAGMVILGDSLVTFPAIPPGKEKVTYHSECPQQCTSNWTHDIIVFGDLLHAHAIGTKLWSNIWEGTKFIGKLNHVDFFNWSFQAFTRMETPIKRGQSIQTYCTYNSKSRKNATRFYLASTDEMCFEFVSYYPILLDETNTHQYGACGYANLLNTKRAATLCGGGGGASYKSNLHNPSSLALTLDTYEPGLEFGTPSKKSKNST